MASIHELAKELETKIKETTVFQEAGFYVYNMDELEQQADSIGFPIAGVVYEGRKPIASTSNPAKSCTSATVVTVTYSVIVGVNYQYLTNTDNKQTATDLLDSILRSLLGFKGVNNRPWRYVGDYPIEGEIEGVIFYGQLWETDIPMIGTFQQP